MLSAAVSTTGIDSRVQELINLVEQGRFQEAWQLEAKLKLESFEIKQQLPFFLNLAKKLDVVQAFQQFRIPGTDRIVVDRREPELGKPSHDSKDEAKKETEKAKQDTVRDTIKISKDESRTQDLKENLSRMRVLDGKLVKEKEDAHQAGKVDGGSAGQALDRQASSERVTRLLSKFEQLIIERFENGKTVANESADGKAKFLEKTEVQWKEFFRSLFDRTVQKKTSLSEVAEVLFRGMVSSGKKGVFIGDLLLTNGRVDKFVRFSVLADMLARLKNLAPGETLGKGDLGLTGEELMYLALSASRGREFVAEMKAGQGRFMDARAEAQAKEALGLPIHEHLKQKSKILKGKHGGGGFGRFLEGDGAAGETPYQFIPWWHWGNLGRPGKPKRVTTLLYIALFVLSVIGVCVLTYRLMR